MLKVEAQLNNGDPCPKKEYRAWEWVEAEFSTLAECVKFLLDQEASGFRIWQGNECIAEYVAMHYGNGGYG